jgi:multidrug efflux pump subunit AcrA (membrane-fusion protein)
MQRSILTQERPSRRGLTIVISFIVFAGFVGYLFFPSESDSTTQFVTSEVIRGDLTIQVTATGTLEPLNQVDVGSEISGANAALRFIPPMPEVQQNTGFLEQLLPRWDPQSGTP